jgi:pimeloyl-ACP methyl ester carboxylesterase
MPIAFCILVSLLAWPSLPGVFAAQPSGLSPVCDEAATPQASPVTEGAGVPLAPILDGPIGVFHSDASEIELEHGGALLWRSGERSVLLLHGAAYDAASWEAEARAMASQGFTVLAMEELAPDAARDGLAYLMDACGASGVTVIGASAGGGPALEVLSEDPTGIAGLILLGATGDVRALREYPKLFVASEGEGLAERLTTMVGEAPGEQNEMLILPGSAHAQAIFGSDQGDALVEAILTFLNNETATWGDEVNR